MSMPRSMKAGIRRAMKTAVVCGAIALASGWNWGEEPRRNPTDQAATVTASFDAPDSLRENTHRIWSILDVVERHHILAPSRVELWKIVAPILHYPGEAATLDKLVDELVRCGSADEFAALFRKRWEDQNRPPMVHDQLPGATVSALAKAGHLGPLRLIRARDYAVEQQLRGNRYVGLGVSLRVDGSSRRPQFATVLPGGVAERGGLKDGVTVLEVDGRSTFDVPTEVLLDWLRGSVGSDVTLKVIPAGSDAEKTITLTRGLVRIDSVFTSNHQPIHTGQVRPNTAEPIGLLEVSGITGSTLQELREAEVRLRSDGVRVLLLDFRNSHRSDNFHQARLIADGLLDGGTLWIGHERNEEPRAEVADRECLFRGMPLVILIDHSTGEAHTAIAAALQDEGRAVIVGQCPSFSGDIPSGIALSDGQFVLWLNTARLARARAARSWPLVPDHSVALAATTLHPLIVQNENVVKQPRITQPRFAMPKQPVVPFVFHPTAAQAQVVQSGEGAVSALAPSNLTHNEILLRMRQSGQKPNWTQQAEFQQQQQLIDMSQQRASAVLTAQQIARDLLRKLPPSP